MTSGEYTIGSPLSGDLEAYRGAAAGTVLPRFRTGVDRARQERYHRCCEIDTSVFADRADVTILAQDNSRATTKAGLPNDGRVHTRQVIRQRSPITVDENLVITGRIGGYRDARRGCLLTCLYLYLRGDGSVPLEMECEYLLPYAEPPAQLDLEVQFKRPVFWDDVLTVQHSSDHRRFRCANAAGLSTAEMTAQRLGFTQ